MSEQNKDRLSREDWLKNDRDPSSGTEPDTGKVKMDEWEKKALRGRALLSDEAEAAALLQDLDTAIANTYGEDTRKVIPARKWSPRFWFSAAAAVLLLFSAAWWLWPDAAGPGQLYAQYFTHRDNDLSVNLMGPQDQDALTESLRPYNARRYEEAVVSIGQYLQAHPEHQPVRLYYGISLMESGATAKAVTQFQLVQESDISGQYPQAATWYLALAYLKAGQVQPAQNTLQTISDPGHPYYLEATSLLKQLK